MRKDVSRQTRSFYLPWALRRIRPLSSKTFSRLSASSWSGAMDLTYSRRVPLPLFPVSLRMTLVKDSSLPLTRARALYAASDMVRVLWAMSRYVHVSVYIFPSRGPVHRVRNIERDSIPPNRIGSYDYLWNGSDTQGYEKCRQPKPAFSNCACHYYGQAENRTEKRQRRISTSLGNVSWNTWILCIPYHTVRT